VINRGEPACFLTHWPGMYANGTGVAFRTFRGTVQQLNRGFADRIRWMKLTEIARYWAAKELTAISHDDGAVQLKAPFATPGFTMEMPLRLGKLVTTHAGVESPFEQVRAMQQLRAGTYLDRNAAGCSVVCFDLKKGITRVARRV
ncbi:MAG: hypothetical protein AAGD07_10015, partial [Planctomycetota bacterium]